MRKAGFAILAMALAAAAGAAPRAEILWDTWGVPHIFAKDAESLFYAFGWAQAASHGDLLLRLYGQARGRGAEYFGEEHLERDRALRTYGVPARARQWYEAQSPAFRRNLDAFAAGVNAYAAKHPERIAAPVRDLLPITATDVLAHTQRIIHFTFVAPPNLAAQVGAELALPFRAQQAAPLHMPAGSNAWAIGPQRSASKKAMLLANPHLPWSDFYLFYEAHLVAPGINAHGATLVGFPVLGIAFNDFLGWTHTVNAYDGADLYRLTLVEGGYRWDGDIRPFETEEQTLKIKGKDGKLREEKLVIRRSIHGPAFTAKGGAVALRVAGIDQPGMLQQWWDMARAGNLRDFEAALKRLQLPMFTVMYADRAGNILHLFNGRVPVRPKGDWNWQGIVPGETSATLWTRTHPYEDLPRVLNPPSGWLQNANDPPWTTTFPVVLDPNKFPPYMAPRRMAFRPQRSARMLDEDPAITFDEMVQYKHSSRMELADRILDDLLQATRGHTGVKIRRAVAVLEAWDRSADATSRGGVLFYFFVSEWNRRSKGQLFATPWNETAPRTTPDGLADPKMALEALEWAVDLIEQSERTLDAAWGEVFRFRSDNTDLPANGAPDALGVFRNIGFAPQADRHFVATGGDSYVAAVEFSRPVRARTVLSYGNWSQPGSKHRGDQLPLLSRKEMKPVWRARKEIEAHLEAREVF